MNDRLRSWLYLIILSMIWGSSFLLIKMGLMDPFGNERLKPSYLAALRLSLAFVFLIPFVFIHLKKTFLKDLFPLLISGVLGNGVPAFLFSYAEIHLSSAITSMLNSLVPVFTILIAVMIFNFKWKTKHFLGMLISIIGSLFIVNFQVGVNQFSTQNILAIIFVLIGSLCYAISLNVIKYKLKHLHPNHITSISFCFVGLPCIIYLIISDFPSYIYNNTMGQDGMIAVIILAVICTSFAVLLFNHLIKISNPVFASSITYFIPIIALFLGLLYGEKITLIQVYGLLFLLLGILLINNNKSMSKLKQLF